MPAKGGMLAMSFQPVPIRLSVLVSVVIALLLVVSVSAQDRPKIEIVPNIPHSRGVTSVAFSPDGTLLASGSIDKTLKVWDAATGELLRTFAANQVASVAFSPGGARVLSGGDDQTLKLWDVATGQLLRTFAGHAAGVL